MPPPVRFGFYTLAAALVAAALSPAVADEKKDDGWVALFNGKDLTGWKMFPTPNKEIKKITPREVGGKAVAFDGEVKDGKSVPLWEVKDGTIVCSGPHSHLFTDGADYDNFHYKVEVKINDKGNSGMFFRTAFGQDFPKGYEVQINATHGDPVKTGSLYPAQGLEKYKKDICVMNTAPHKPNEFFTQEVIADGPKITILVNGTQTKSFTDPEYRFKKGHFALQAHDPGSTASFKSVMYKPLPASGGKGRD